MSGFELQISGIGSDRSTNCATPLPYNKLLVQVEPPIVQWIHLHLSSCSPGFDPQAKHLRFLNLYFNCDQKGMKINKKKAGIGPLIVSLLISFPYSAENSVGHKITFINLIISVSQRNTIFCVHLRTYYANITVENKIMI